MEAQCEANAGGVCSIPAPGGSHTLRSSWTRAPQLLSLSSRARAGAAAVPAPGARLPTEATAAGATGEERLLGRAEETPSQQRKPSTAPNQ